MQKQAKVYYKIDAGHKTWHLAYSEDIPGLNLCSGNVDALYRDIPAATEILMKLNKGVRCKATMVDTVEAFRKRTSKYNVRPLVFVVNLEIK